MANNGNGNGDDSNGHRFHREAGTLFVVGDAAGNPVGALSVNKDAEFQWVFDENVSISERTGAVAELMVGQLLGLEGEMILTTATATLLRLLHELTDQPDEMRLIMDRIKEIVIEGIALVEGDKE